MIFFVIVQKDTKTVKMMYQKKKFPFGYISDLKCKVLEMPYQGGKLSMAILLSEDTEDKSTGLEEVTGSQCHGLCFLSVFTEP